MLVYADGSAMPLEHGHGRPLIKFAAWNSETNRFIVGERIAFLKKADLVNLAELEAIKIAMTLEPSVVYSDSKQMIERARRLGFLKCPVEWIPRKQNKVADWLSKAAPGEGTVIFNSPKPCRGWITLIYD